MDVDRGAGELSEWEDTRSRVRGKCRASVTARGEELGDQGPLLHTSCPGQPQCWDLGLHVQGRKKRPGASSRPAAQSSRSGATKLGLSHRKDSL